MLKLISLVADRIQEKSCRHAAILLLLLGAGCFWGPKNSIISLPSKHTIEEDLLVVRCEFPISPDHPIMADLKSLRKRVVQDLALPEPTRPVVVYLFESPERYHAYMRKNYPHIPDRRAYFIGTPKESAVYTYWGDRIQEDLRHEYTHGVLHSCLSTVPLWLDEGLAEYYEVPGEPGSLNSDYATKLQESLQSGWQPDLARLEKLEEVAQMQRPDYGEAWAWVHFMLHFSEDTRGLLLEYLADLREGEPLDSLQSRLARLQPAFDLRFASYLGTLTIYRATAG